MSSPLRIAMVTEYAYPVLGGISEHVHFLSAELAARGHDVRVITSRAPEPTRETAARADALAERDFGYRTVRIGTSLPIPINGSIARMTVDARPLRATRRAIGDADVVHAQGLVGPLLPLAAAQVSRAPCTVATFHTYVEGSKFLYWAWKLPMNHWLSKFDRRIAVSQVCVDSLVGFFPGHYDVIPNGIDCTTFTPLESEADRDPGPPRILFVGRFDPRNGLATLLDAARILADQGRDFRVQIVGDGPLRPVYERQARRLGVWDRLEWLGLLKDERPELYRQATVLAAPCTLASFGVVLLEAFASGTPVVAADNVGFRQVMRDGAPGRFVEPSSADALAAGLGEVLDDPAMRADWSARGRRVALERYAWPTVASRIEDLYREVLDGRTASAPPGAPTNGARPGRADAPTRSQT
ncbi:MAG: glycosyltransferase family 4 protein [Thermoleophilia bacterium]|nr:glycosyltransferase family 4 protein [Thermoleophilia bacterium]